MNNFFKILLIFIFFALSSCKRPPLPPPVVIFDYAHGQKTGAPPENISPIFKLENFFKHQNFIVKKNSSPFTESAVKNVDAIIICGPQTPFSNEEIMVISKYLKEGGQLCIMVSSASSVARLLASLQISIANGYVKETDNLLGDSNPHNFSIHNLPKHPLTKNISTINIYGGWPLNTALEANIIAKTSPNSWVDLNNNNVLDKRDAQQAFPMIVTGQIGHGHFIVIGDDEALNNTNMRGGNKQLGKNISSWFKEGSYY